MRARQLFLAVSVASCLAVACGDDDSKPGGKGGAAGQAGAAGEGGKAGSGGSPTNGGTESSPGGDGNPVGEAGGPGAAGMNPGGLGGAGGEAPSGFVEFVHDLVENHTLETNQPAATNQQFTEPQDDHGHYLAPASAFDDLL
jgi:hypothetical protein